MADAFPNPEQERVLAHRAGALLVLAPAGTGKTRVMAERLARAIASGVHPARTLGLTFTNAQPVRCASRWRRCSVRHPPAPWSRPSTGSACRSCARKRKSSGCRAIS